MKEKRTDHSKFRRLQKDLMASILWNHLRYKELLSETKKFSLEEESLKQQLDKFYE